VVVCGDHGEGFGCSCAYAGVDLAVEEGGGLTKEW
jgi:hypothetical protein